MEWVGPSAGIGPFARRWRGTVACLVIASGVMAAANAQSLGLLAIDFAPGQTTDLNAPQSDDGGGASRARSWDRSRSASAGPSAAAWTGSGRILQLAGADMTLDWAAAPPARSDDTTMDDPPDDPEFAQASSPADGDGGVLQTPAFGRADSVAGMVGGSLGAVGGGGDGGIGQMAAATKTPDALATQSDSPLQAAVAPTLAAGPVPEPATWASIILGLGLVGAMLRGARRSRTA